MKKLILACSAVATLLIGCGGGGSGGGPNEVQMVQGQKFEPDTLTVEAGTTVKFVNNSSETHTVTAVEDELPVGATYFSSGGASNEEDANSNLSEGLIDPDQTFEVTLDVPGTYNYYCIPHKASGMTGEIVVEESSNQ